MTAALEGGEWSAARPGRTLPPGKTRYPIYRRLGGPQGRSGRAENLVPTAIRSRTLQPVVSRYTDWATGPTRICNTYCFSSAIVTLTCLIITFIRTLLVYFDFFKSKNSPWIQIQFMNGVKLCCPLHAMQMYRGRGDIAVLFLNPDWG